MKFLNVSKHKWISPVVSQEHIVRSDSNIRLIRHTDDDTKAGPRVRRKRSQHVVVTFYGNANT